MSSRKSSSKLLFFFSSPALKADAHEIKDFQN